VESWKKDGYALVETGISHKFYEEAADAAYTFIAALSEEQKQKLQRCFVGEDDKDHGLLGYSEFNPTKVERGTDRAFFHYHPEVKKLFAQELADVPEAQEFVTRMDAIWYASFAAAEAVVADLDKTNPGLRAALLPPGIPPAFTIRFVLYKKPPEGQLLSSAHYDRSSVTLALAESSPGLRIRDAEGNMNLITRPDGVTPVMASKGMQKFAPSIPLSWHDAVQTTDATVRGTHSRWVAIGQLFSGGLRLLDTDAS